MSNEKVKFLLNWNHFADHLSSCMTKLMTDISYSDIIIATADKHMIYSHRFVLANSSKYFQRLLKHMKKQKEVQLVVALPEIKYEIFKILMNYMYKGETQVPHELLPSVIKAGQFLEIIGLVNLSENESNASKYNYFASEQHSHSRHTNIHSSYSNTSQGQENKKSSGSIGSSVRSKAQGRENTNVGTRNFSATEKLTKSQTESEKNTLESFSGSESGKENRDKVEKLIKVKNLQQENNDFIQLPLKRKLSMRGSGGKTSSISSSLSSASTENSPSKKSQKTLTPIEMFPIKVENEKESGDDNDEDNTSKNQIPEAEDSCKKITIKEEPDDIEEVVYNELHCEFCHEIYTNPSEWVKHMTEHHEDRGYQTHKDLDKSGGSTMITCVVCSCVCFSAAEWANHLRIWHTDRELTDANMAAPKKTNTKVKKKSGISKKQ